MRIVARARAGQVVLVDRHDGCHVFTRNIVAAFGRALRRLALDAIRRGATLLGLLGYPVAALAVVGGLLAARDAYYPERIFDSSPDCAASYRDAHCGEATARSMATGSSAPVCPCRWRRIPSSHA